MAVRTLCTSIEREPHSPIKVTWFTARRKMGATQSSRSKSPMATPKPGDSFFDYGCQYMSPVFPEFRDRELERWKGLGLASDRFEVSVLDAARDDGSMKRLETTGWVGNGGMGPMLEALTVQTRVEFEGSGALKHISGFPQVEQQVVSIRRDEQIQKWFLNSSACEHGPYDYVIGAFGHPKRTDPFLKGGGKAAKPMMTFLRGVKYNQFFVLQVVLEKGHGQKEEAILKRLSACHVLNHSVLSFVADNSKKPHQGDIPPRDSAVKPRPHITLISTAEFAHTNKKGDRKKIQVQMLGAFAELILKRSSRDARAKFRPRIHRLNYWGDGRCLNVVDGTGADDCVFDAAVNLGWCGEFCVAPCVDGAAQSGVAVAKRCMKELERSMDSTQDPQEVVTTVTNKWKSIKPDRMVVDIGRFSHLGLIDEAEREEGTT